MNPWNLTKREEEVMTTLIANGGSCKVACHVLGIAKQTADTMAHRAKERMQARTRIDALLMFDRWAREQ